MKKVIMQWKVEQVTFMVALILIFESGSDFVRAISCISTSKREEVTKVNNSVV